MSGRAKVVVFDLGKVLLDFDYGRLARNMQEHCEIPFEKLLSALNQSHLLHRYETGLITSQAFFEEVKLLSKFRHDFERFEPLFANIFTPVDEMIRFHERLSRQGVPTFIFSNTNEMAVRHIRREYAFFSKFTEYIFSFEHRSMKPDARLYEVVEEKTGHNGEQILYIDDRPENIETAVQRGWQAIQHVEPERTIPRATVLLGISEATAGTE